MKICLSLLPAKPPSPSRARLSRVPQLETLLAQSHFPPAEAQVETATSPVPATAPTKASSQVLQLQQCPPPAEVLVEALAETPAPIPVPASTKAPTAASTAAPAKTPVAAPIEASVGNT